MIEFAENKLEWFKSTEFYDYFNWLLAQPSSDLSGVVIVGGVLVVVIIVAVWALSINYDKGKVE
jgi:hypothetical protein